MLKRYVDFINESNLDSFQQLPTGIDYIKDITYELVEYFNDEFANMDPISNFQYGILGYMSNFNFFTVPEGDVNYNIPFIKELANKSFSANVESGMKYGWYMKFPIDDMWICDDEYGNLIKGTLSDARYSILKRIKLKANDAGYIMKIFHRRSEADDDFKYLLFIHTDSLVDLYDKNLKPIKVVRR